MISIRQFWDNQNSSLNRDTNDIFYFKKASEHRSVLNDNDSVVGILDLGCGAGELLQYLSQLANIDIGLDYSQEMVNAARHRLKGQFSGLLIQADISTHLPIAQQQVWTTTGAINQYLDDNNLACVLDFFCNNEKAHSFYLFDCIDPLRYDLLLHSISYRPEHIERLNFFDKIKMSVRRIMIGFRLMFNYYENDSRYLGSPSMGFGQRPAFWLNNCAARGLNVEIISSRYYEYRYHVIIKKS